VTNIRLTNQDLGIFVEPESWRWGVEYSFCRSLGAHPKQTVLCPRPLSQLHFDVKDRLIRRPVYNLRLTQSAFSSPAWLSLLMAKRIEIAQPQQYCPMIKRIAPKELVSPTKIDFTPTEM